MSISTDFGDAQRWAQTHFGGVSLGDVRRRRRVVTLAAGWGPGQTRRPPAASLTWPAPSPARGHLRWRCAAARASRRTKSRLHVSFSPALARRALQRPGGATGKGAPVPGSVVRVWEERAPDATGPALEWLLLCDQPVTDFAHAPTRLANALAWPSQPAPARRRR